MTTPQIRRYRRGRGRESQRAHPQPPGGLELTAHQLAAIRAVMHLFVEDDLARGVAPGQRLSCDACRQSQPLAGFIRYEPYLLCNDCATEYEVALARGLVLTAAQFVEDRTAGEPQRDALPGAEPAQRAPCRRQPSRRTR